MTCQDDSDSEPRAPGSLGGVAKRTVSRIANGGRWLFGAAAISGVVVIAARRGEATEFARLVRTIRPLWILAAAVLQAGTYACDASIWRLVVARAGTPPPFQRLFRLAICRVFVTQAVPSGGVSGDVVVVRGLEKYGVPLEASMTALVINLFGFYGAFAACALVSVFVFHASGGVSSAILPIVLPFSLLLLAMPALVGWLVRSSHEPGRPSWWSHVPGLAPVLDALGHARLDLLRDRGLLGRSTAVQIVTFLLDAATLYVMLAALGHAAPPPGVLAAFILASAAELVGPMPGGLGAFEGGAIVGLRAFGVPIETALLATLLLRGFTFWLPMIPGFFIARWAVEPSANRGPR